MLDRWVFILGAALIVIAEIQLAFVLRKQYKLFKNKTSLQPLKRLLFAAVLLLMIGALPLLFVYLNIVWFHFQAIWIVYVSVLANAFAKVVTGFVLNLVYTFRGENDDSILG